MIDRTDENFLPTKNELYLKMFCAPTDAERLVAEQLLKTGIFRDDGEHCHVAQLRMDPGAVMSNDLIDELVAGTVMDDELRTAQRDDGYIVTIPAEPLIPIPPSEELGASMKKLLGQQPQREPAPVPKYIVAPKGPPSKPSSEMLWIDFIDFDNNRPLL
jgi:hypothetical protein